MDWIGTGTHDHHKKCDYCVKESNKTVCVCVSKIQASIIIFAKDLLQTEKVSES